MRKNRVAIILVLLFTFFSVSLFSARPAEAGWFDWMGFNENAVENKVSKHASALSAADEGSSNRDENVTGTSGSFQIDFYCRLSGCKDNDKGNNSLESSSGYLTEEQKIALNKRYGNGAIGDVSNGIAMMFTKPADTQRFVADVMQSAKVVPPAQAQGLGFAALDPILSTWKVMRNIAYLFFVVIFLIIGFMIMFRQKVGGQTVVTAQQAIPNIIVSLVLVTFSYAIAGFLIDIMYLVMYLMIGLFGADAQLMDKNFLQLGMSLVTGSGGVNSSAFATVNDAIQDFVGAIDLGAAGDALGWISGITFGLIVTVAILIGVFKLFFELLKTYITIILAIAFAPMMLMMGAMPGKNTFVPWLKLVIGNLAAFPTVLLMLILYNEMTKSTGGITEGGFMPPYLIGQGFGGALTTLVGVGIILVMPEAVKKAKEVLGAKSGIWEEFAKNAWSNTKGAWNGTDVPGGLGAKKLMGAAASVPFMAGGAYAGNRYATDIAKKQGLSESQTRRNQVVGSIIGGGLGVKAPAIAKNLGKSGFSQGRDAIVKGQAEKYAGLFGEFLQMGKSSGEQKLAQENKDAAQTASNKSPTWDPSKDGTAPPTGIMGN